MGIQTSGQGTGAGSGVVRCTDCGGLNPADAQWCGQCLRSFAPPPPPPPPPPPTASVSLLEPRRAEQSVDQYFSEISGDLGPVHPLDFPRHAESKGIAVDPIGHDPLGADGSHAFAGDPTGAGEPEHVAPVVPLDSRARPSLQATEGAITWTCRLCETLNPLSADSCEVCGSTFADTMRPVAPPVTGDPNLAAMYSLFWPGAGHAYLGQWGQAVARAIMSAWVLLVTAFLLFGASGGGSKIFAVVFGFVATGLWLAAAHDAYREASGQPTLVILQGRRYLYITATLIAMLFLMLLAGAATAAS